MILKSLQIHCNGAWIEQRRWKWHHEMMDTPSVQPQRPRATATADVRPSSPGASTPAVASPSKAAWAVTTPSGRAADMGRNNGSTNKRKPVRRKTSIRKRGGSKSASHRKHNSNS